MIPLASEPPAESVHLPWRFSRLLDAPHRLAFALAAFVLSVSGLWWAAVNLTFALGGSMPWSVPPSIAHSVVMTFGFMPLFFVGFLFTAGPKWLWRPAVNARDLLPLLLPQGAGWVVFLFAIHIAEPPLGLTLGVIGLSMVALGWLGIVWRFMQMLRASTVPDKVHARLVAAACWVGFAALLAVIAGWATGQLLLVRAAVQAGLWAFIGVVFAAVAHRMIPFFTAAAVPRLDVWRPLWLLWAFVFLFLVEAFFQATQALGFVLGRGGDLVRALVELPMAAGLLALALRWGLVQSLRIRLLAMLHLGFTWLGISLLLFGVQHALQAAGGHYDFLTLACIHTYTMGYLGSTLLAMVTRVSCGHGGRALTADNFVWWLFWLLQFAVVARVAAVVLMHVNAYWGIVAICVAAVAWATTVTVWALRYGWWYGTPRADGRPG